MYPFVPLKHSIATFLLTILCISAHSQTLTQFSHYTVDDGLSENNVTSLLQDRKGNMWFGTYDGLNKFDGYSFKIFDNNFSLTNYRIDKIKEDCFGYIWVQANDGRVYRFDPSAEKFLAIPQGIGPYRTFKQSLKIFGVFDDGTVWLSNNDVNSPVLRIKSFAGSDKIEITSLDCKIARQGAAQKLFVTQNQSGNTTILTSSGAFLVAKGSNRIRTVVPALGQKMVSLCDELPELYFGHEQGGLSAYDSHKNSVRRLPSPFHSKIIALLKISVNQLFILSEKEGFALYNTSNGNFKRFTTNDGSGLKSNNLAIAFKDIHSKIWIETKEQNIVLFDPAKPRVTYFTAPFEKLIRDSSNHFFIIDGNNGETWIQSNSFGFCRYNSQRNELRSLNNDIRDKKRMFPNIRAGMFDKQGNLWLSFTNLGIGKVVFRQNPFSHYKIDENSDFSEQNQVRSLFQDKENRLWVGTKNGMLHLYDSSMHYMGRMGADGRLNSKTPLNAFVYNISADHSGTIWLSSKGQGLFRVKSISGGNNPVFEITNFRHNPKDIYSLNSDLLYYTFEDSHRRLWIATFGGGLNLMEVKNGQAQFIHYQNRLKNYPANQCLIAKMIVEDKQGLIYVGTSRGLLVFNPANLPPEKMTFHVFAHDEKDKQSISGNEIRCVLPSKSGKLYVGTYGNGLNVVDNGIRLGEKPRFRVYNRDSGIFSDIVATLQEDKNSNIWLTTQSRLVKFDSRTEQFEIYNPIDLAPYAFMEASMCSTRQGDFLYGTTEGFVRFNPAKILQDKFIPPVVFTQLQVLNQPMTVGDKNSPLTKTIDAQSEVILNHRQDIISIGFATLDFRDPASIRYAYKLDGVDADWNYVGNQRIAIYNNLSKGTYLFHIKSTDAMGRWMNNERTLTIVKRPSFWESWWGILFYIFMFFVISGLTVYILFTYFKLKNDIEVEHRITNLKLRFFTDVSHELRTPLTLIVSPVEKILRNEDLPAKVKEQLTFVQHNAERMLRLVNQLLDFRKVQNKKMKLIIEQVNVGNYVKEIAMNFCGLADEPGVKFTVQNNTNNASLWVDKDKFEKILFNLLSNAFKYTQLDKEIKVIINEDEEKVHVSVIDQGVGIGKEMLKRIFGRFESLATTDNRIAASTGIGLSLTKELVELHKATIEVDSELGKGSSFKVSFLKGYHHYSNNDDYVLQDLTSSNQDTLNNRLVLSENQPIATGELYTLLIAEDNEELRAFLVSILKGNYNVLEAANGKEVLALLPESAPDLIISDIMMPEMDGLELTKIIKNDLNYSHIPIILLTAKSDTDSKVEAMKYGAEDYITKPFTSAYLEARIENILRLRKQLQEYYRVSLPDNLNPIANNIISSKDELFIQDVRKFIELNIDDSELSIDSIALHLGLSRSSMFKKIKSLTGLAPVDFIKELRLQKAAQLIEMGEYNVSQVSYMVGIDDPRYFSKCFKQKYGVTPREYKGKSHL